MMSALLTLTLFFAAVNCANHTTDSLNVDVLPNEIFPHLTTRELFGKILSTNKGWYFAAIEALSIRTKELSLKQIRFILNRIQKISNLPRSRLELLSLKYKQEVAGRSGWLSGINGGRHPIILNMNRSFGLYSVTTSTEHMDIIASIKMQDLNQNMTVARYLNLQRVTKKFFILIRNHKLTFIMYRQNDDGQSQIINLYSFQCPTLPWTPIDKVWLKLWVKSERPHVIRAGNVFHQTPNRAIMDIIDIHIIRDQTIWNEIEQQLQRPTLTEPTPDLLQQAFAARMDGQCCGQ